MDRKRQYKVLGEIYYDAVNKRIREFEMEEIGREREVYDKLKLYNLVSLRGPSHLSVVSSRSRS